MKKSSLTPLASVCVIAALLAYPITGNVQTSQSQQGPCHVLIGKQCVNLIGKWYVSHGKTTAPDAIEISPKDNREKFSFVLEVVRGGSLTHIEGDFDLKSDIGLYSGPSPGNKQKVCSIVFMPISAKQLKIVSFGECEEGFRAFPDGSYTKNARGK